MSKVSESRAPDRHASRSGAILSLWRETFAATGRTPTIREAASALQSSDATVHRALSALVDQGRLAHVPGRARPYIVVVDAEEPRP